MTSFVRAAYYAAIRRCRYYPGSVAEVDEGALRRWSERHLQCVWFDERLRPGDITMADGESIKVLNPGEWNLEAGPDFKAATIVDGKGRELTGNIEIHVHPRDWDAHGHADNPLYKDIIAHVTYFSGKPPKTLPPEVIRIALAPLLQDDPSFSFDDIDTTAYPHAIIPATPRPCARALGGDPDRAAMLFDAAGEFRIQAKALRLSERIAEGSSSRQILYEEIMAALGYKQNTGCFRKLAQVLPLSEWDEACDTTTAYGRLLGAAGLLPQPESVTDPALAPFIRRLWDAWWRNPVSEPLESTEWITYSLRPQNHPIRRLAAAAVLFNGHHNIFDRLANFPATPPQAWFRAAVLLFEEASKWPFWNDRLTLSGPATPRAGALLGVNRIAAMVTNVVIPWLVSEGRFNLAALDFLAPEDISSPVRATAHHLLGRDHNPYAIYAGNGLRVQGILQIYADFCLNARVDCEGCMLTTALLEERNK